MSSYKEIIARVDEGTPNAFTNARKFRWLAALDGRLAADVFQMGIEEIRALPHRYPEDLNAEPLVGFPHDDLYDYWLQAQIDAGNGEYDKYQNSMVLYNESYNNFCHWFCTVYKPAGGSCTDPLPGVYITAYGLAVKAGYRGTLEEWLMSIKGEKGDTGKSAYQYAQEAGYTGTEDAFRENLLNSGKTAYEYAVDGGYTGSVQDFRAKMAVEYAEKNHGHAGVYAPENHDHAGVYAPENHDHAGVYASENHDHAGAYLAIREGVVVQPIVLVENVHYGTEPPGKPQVGQLFYIPVGEAVNL